jgi:hypothetical protein
MTGDWSVDVPTYDAVFAAFAKQWPQLPEELKVCTYMLQKSPIMFVCTAEFLIDLLNRG